MTDQYNNFINNLLGSFRATQEIFGTPFRNKLAQQQYEQQRQQLENAQQAYQQNAELFPETLRSARAMTSRNEALSSPLGMIDPRLVGLLNLPDNQQKQLGISGLTGKSIEEEENIPRNGVYSLAQNIIRQALGQPSQKDIIDQQIAEQKLTAPSPAFEKFGFSAKTDATKASENINLLKELEDNLKHFSTFDRYNPRSLTRIKIQTIIKNLATQELRNTANVRNKREWDFLISQLGNPRFMTNEQLMSIVNRLKGINSRVLKNYSDYSNYNNYAKANRLKPDLTGLEEFINKNSENMPSATTTNVAPISNQKVDRSAQGANIPTYISNPPSSPMNQSMGESSMGNLFNQPNAFRNLVNQYIGQPLETLSNIPKEAMNAALIRPSNFLADILNKATGNTFSRQRLPEWNLDKRPGAGTSEFVGNVLGNLLPYNRVVSGLERGAQYIPEALTATRKIAPLLARSLGGGAVMAAESPENRGTGATIGAAIPFVSSAVSSVGRPITQFAKKGIRSALKSDIGQSVANRVKNLLSNVPGNNYGQRLQNLFNTKMKEASNAYQLIEGIPNKTEGLAEKFDKQKLFPKNFSKNYKNILNKGIKKLSETKKEKALNKDVIKYLRSQRRNIPSNFKEAVKDYRLLNRAFREHNEGKTALLPSASIARQTITNLKYLLSNAMKKNGNIPTELSKAFSKANKNYADAMLSARVPNAAGTLKPNKGLFESLRSNLPIGSQEKELTNIFGHDFPVEEEEIETGIPEDFGKKFIKQYPNALNNLKTIFKVKNPEEIARKILESDIINSAGEIDMNKVFNRMDNMSPNVREKIFGKTLLNDINQVRKSIKPTSVEGKASSTFSKLATKGLFPGIAIGAGALNHPAIGTTLGLSLAARRLFANKLVKNPRFMRWLFSGSRPTGKIGRGIEKRIRYTSQALASKELQGGNTK